METPSKKLIAIFAAAAAALAGLFVLRAFTGGSSLIALVTGGLICTAFLAAVWAFLQSAEGALAGLGDPPPALTLGERSLRRAVRHPWAKLVMFMLLTRAALYIAAYIAYTKHAGGYAGGLFDTMRAAWLRTDSPSYLGIAERWYVTEGDPRFHIVFFPLYPLAIRLFNYITGDSFASAMAVSNLAATGAAILAYELFALDMPVKKALRAVKYLFIAPAAFFFAAPMTESLFLLLTLGAAYLIRKRKYLPACILGALSAFTRSAGVLILALAAGEWLIDLIGSRRRLTLRAEGWAYARRALAMCIVPLGLLGYIYINWRVTGDPFKFMEYQRDHWSQNFGFFFEAAGTHAEYALRALSYGETGTFFALWLPNLLATFGALTVAAAAGRKLRPSYMLYFLVCFIITCGTTWLLSAPRYLSVVFPLALAAAELTEKRAADLAATALCLALQWAFVALYVITWNVY